MSSKQGNCDAGMQREPSRGVVNSLEPLLVTLVNAKCCCDDLDISMTAQGECSC